MCGAVFAKAGWLLARADGATGRGGLYTCGDAYNEYGDGGAIRAGARPNGGVRPAARAALGSTSAPGGRPVAPLFAGLPPPVAARIHGRADIVAPWRGRIARCGKACGATAVSRTGTALFTCRGPALMCTVAPPRVRTRSFVTSVVRWNIPRSSRAGRHRGRGAFRSAARENRHGDRGP